MTSRPTYPLASCHQLHVKNSTIQANDRQSLCAFLCLQLNHMKTNLTVVYANTTASNYAHQNFTICNSSRCILPLSDTAELEAQKQVFTDQCSNVHRKPVLYFNEDKQSHKINNTNKKTTNQHPQTQQHLDTRLQSQAQPQPCSPLPPTLSIFTKASVRKKPLAATKI